MNIKDLFTTDNSVSAQSLFKSESGNATVIQIQAGGKLKEHTSKTAALLICIRGHAVFGDEKGVHQPLHFGDYVHIEPMVKHWIDGIDESQFILIK
jgi:quercetin dioxygenase-like cupin family protein